MNRHKPVSKFMTSDIITLHPDDNLNIVENTFGDHKFHHIPILETDGSISGIVSKTDLLQISAIRREFSEKDFQRIQVKDFMTRVVVTINPDHTLEEVAEILQHNKFHALPVVDQGKVVGIVTTHDVIQGMMS